MLRLFAKDLPDTWASFDDAIKDIETTKTFVHKIKGTAGNLDLLEVHQCALQFETSMRNGAPDKSLYETFVNTCNNLRTLIPAE